MSKKKREQHVMTFDLLRSKKLSPIEIALLTLISSYSKGCYLSAKDLGEHLQVNERHVRRLITRLVRTGLLAKDHGAYKRMHLFLYSPEAQNYWVLRLGDTSREWDDKIKAEFFMSQRLTGPGEPVVTHCL